MIFSETEQNRLVAAYIQAWQREAQKVQALTESINWDGIRGYDDSDAEERRLSAEYKLITDVVDAKKAAVAAGVDEYGNELHAVVNTPEFQQAGDASAAFRVAVDKLRDLGKVRTQEAGKAELAAMPADAPIEDRAAAIFRKYGYRPAPARLRETIDHIKGRTALGHLRDVVGNTDNKASREIFAAITGRKLPATRRDSLVVLDEWFGVTPEQRAQMDAERETARLEKLALDDLVYAWNALKQLNVRLDGGRVVDGQIYVQEKFTEGLTEAGRHKQGASFQYFLTSGSRTNYVKNAKLNVFLKQAIEFGGLRKALEKVWPEIPAEENVEAEASDPEIDALFGAAGAKAAIETAPVDRLEWEEGVFQAIETGWEVTRSDAQGLVDVQQATLEAEWVKKSSPEETACVIMGDKPVASFAPKFSYGQRVRFGNGLYAGNEGVIESINGSGRMVVRGDTGTGFGVTPEEAVAWALEAVPASAPDLDPTTAEGYACVMADEALQLQHQDVLDAYFLQRIVDVRNALRGLGWAYKEGGDRLLRKDSAWLAVAYKQVGADKNVVGATYNVVTSDDRPLTAIDDLSTTPSQLAARIDAAVPRDSSDEDPAYHYVYGELGMTRNGSFTKEKRDWMTFGRDEALPMLSGNILPYGATRRGVFVGAVSGERLKLPAKPVTPQVPAGNMEKYIKVAADSIETLRKVDVYRVLVESNGVEYRAAIAEYIKAKRSDLIDEVDSILADERREKVRPSMRG